MCRKIRVGPPLFKNILCLVIEHTTTMESQFSISKMLYVESTKDLNLILQARKLNYVEWGAKINLSEEKYILREIELADCSFAKQKQETWVLTSKENPTEILSTCGSYECPCLALVDKTVVKGNCYAIETVFTPVQHRKKGFASLLLKDTQIQMMNRAGTIASTLYSDIGPSYYHKLGWKFHESKSLLASIKSIGCEGIEECTIFDITQAKEIFKNVEAEIEKELLEKEEDTFVLLPSFSIIEWWFNQGKFYCDHFQPGKDISSSGALFPSNGDFISWFHDFKDSKLVITYSRTTSIESAKSIYNSALKEGKKWDFKELEIWNPSIESLEAFKSFDGGFSVVDRVDSLSSLCFWGLDGNGKSRDVKWLKNEKYAWC
jgi:hypothetical protein